jgi:hypothetical protein
MKGFCRKVIFGLSERILTAWQEPAIFFARRKQAMHDKGAVSSSMACVPQENQALAIQLAHRIAADGKKKIDKQRANDARHRTAGYFSGARSIRLQTERNKSAVRQKIRHFEICVY